MAVQTYNLGTVTAYGDAKAGGYTGTLAEWQALMANYATVGQQAAQSAQIASTKASEASTSAESAQSAKTAAETAQQRAETAQQRAETAAASITVDNTLSIAGKAADAKATGDAINNINSNLVNLVATALVTDSASGEVAHFVDGADSVPMKSVKVNIVPVQSGSGDPSPDNVRPISGFNSVKVTRNGRNFCKCIVTATRTNLNGLTATPNGDGSITINGTATATTILYFNLAVENGANSASQANGTKNIRSGTYRFKELPSGIYLQIYGSDMPNAGTSDAHLIKEGRKGSFTVDDTYQYNWIRLLTEKDTTFNNVVIYPAIYLASDTDDTYDPYNGNTYNISLASAGTVYGGTLDVVSGKLTVDKKYELFDGSSDEAWQFLTGSFGKRCGIVRNDVLNTGSRVKVDANEGVYSASANTVGTVFASGVSIYYYPPATVTTLEEYKTWLASNPLQVVYPLATPVTYNLTPTEVNSLLGVNNIWSDAGDMDVEYRADTKLYIDKRLAEVTA